MIAFLTLIDSTDDKENFIQLYNRYKNLIYWVAYEKVHNAEDAEECVQETFLYVAKHMEKIDNVESARTKGYLATIATGFAVKIFNKSKKYELVGTIDDVDTDDADYSEFEKSELEAVFDTAIDDESKALLYLKYVYGYSSKEIADMYNVSDSYIRKTIQRIKEKLRKALEEGS